MADAGQQGRQREVTGTARVAQAVAIRQPVWSVLSRKLTRFLNRSGMVDALNIGDDDQEAFTQVDCR